MPPKKKAKPAVGHGDGDETTAHPDALEDVCDTVVLSKEPRSDEESLQDLPLDGYVCLDGEPGGRPSSVVHSLTLERVPLVPPGTWTLTFIESGPCTLR